MSMIGRSMGAGGRVAPPTAAEPVIAVRRLTKSYTTADGPVAALEAIDFDVADGEFIAVLGPSGCG
jgi:NitT/TauT family transport system ATP-binding protein